MTYFPDTGLPNLAAIRSPRSAPNNASPNAIPPPIRIVPKEKPKHSTGVNAV